jgi:hypothetical protein
MQTNDTQNQTQPPSSDDAAIEKLLRSISMHQSHTAHIPAEPFTSQVIAAVSAYEAQRKQRYALLNRIVMLSAPVAIALALLLLGESGVTQVQSSFASLIAGNATGKAWTIVGACVLAQASLAMLMTRTE